MTSQPGDDTGYLHEKYRWEKVFGKPDEFSSKIIEQFKSCCEKYLKEMPHHVSQLGEFRGFIFDRYYWDEDNERILFITKTNRIKLIKPHMMKTHLRISLTDSENRQHNYRYEDIYDFCVNR
jgi:hypothetical protein